jgi:hypothetical protein
MVGCSDRRIANALGGIFISTLLALPAGTLAQEPDDPAPEAQIEDPELRGLHAQMLGLHEQMQDLRAQMAERRRQLLGEDAAQAPPHEGRHAMHLRRLAGGRDMGMGMQGMMGRGMMMGSTMSGQEMMGRRMTGEEMSGRDMMRRGIRGRAAGEGPDPRWCPSGMERGMCRGMPRHGAAGPVEPEGEGGEAGG